MKLTCRLACSLSHLLFFMLLWLKHGLALIPVTPHEQTQRAIFSIRAAIVQQQQQKKCKKPRLLVDYLLPIPPDANAADVDPWPGGLAQMYDTAERIVSEILQGVVDEPARACSSQILSAQDCCGFFVQESATSPNNDIAAILFPGVDQLDKIAEIDRMVGNRTLLLVNRQFQRPADFGFGLAAADKCNKIIFDQFEWGFAFQEFGCRGEDVKLLYETPNWYSCVICSEDEERAIRDIPLLEPSATRPKYADLEKRINEVLPEPLWMRKMGEAESKGLRFQREKKTK